MLATKSTNLSHDDLDSKDCHEAYASRNDGVHNRHCNSPLRHCEAVAEAIYNRHCELSQASEAIHNTESKNEIVAPNSTFLKEHIESSLGVVA